MKSLLTPEEVDSVLRLKPGRAKRLARRGVLAHVTLPDGTIRFRTSEIEALVGCPVSLEETTVSEIAAYA